MKSDLKRKMIKAQNKLEHTLVVLKNKPNYSMSKKPMAFLDYHQKEIQAFSNKYFQSIRPSMDKNIFFQFV